MEYHRKACTEDNPMLKQKGPGYTSQMKAKVNYPKPKSKAKEEASKLIPKEDKFETPTKSVKTKTKGFKTVTQVIDLIPECPATKRKETVTISRQVSPDILTEVKSIQNGTMASKSNSLDSKINEYSSNEALDEEKPLKKLESKSSLTRGPGTFRKNSTFVKKNSDQSMPSKDDIVMFVENEPIFDILQHRKEIMELVTHYARDVRKKKLMSILEHPVFEDTSNLEEVVDLLQDFVKTKSNNNF